MTGAGQSLWDLCILNWVGGLIRPTLNSGGDGAAKAAPIRRTSSGVNLRRVLCIGSWNILSLSKNHRISHLSDELRRLKMDIVRVEGLAVARSVAEDLPTTGLV